MTAESAFPLLEGINTPLDLRRLPEDQLPQLAQELRAFMVNSVARTGGHLASSLGTVELSLALHYVYDTPTDQIVWDVGHQTYAHKILTGRRQYMATLRQKGGLAGFPKREESPYDAFGVGHSSTSISAALGMALAAKINHQSHKTVAVIGDGAMTAGIAFEALNHAGDINADLLVILNDNEMSISPNVGGLSNYLARILSGRFYANMRAGSKKVLKNVPPVWELARRAEEHMKGMVVPGTLFEELGFNYLGPVDGHDLPTLIKMLRNLNQLSGPQFLHIVTRKGKGYPAAENDPCLYHGVSAFNPKTGEIVKSPSPGLAYTQVFGQWLCDMAEQDPRLVAITPAMREGSGLVAYSEKYPSRYFDVGIAEQHSITLAAGLACAGMKPVVAIYSTFMQRAYDQLIHDVALQNLPVLFAIDRAGLVGPDGPTHAGSFDLSFLRCIPNMVIMAPADENECRHMLYTGFLLDQPAAVRYPRGTGMGITPQASMVRLPLGKAELRRPGHEVAILAFGSMVAPALEAAERLNATVVNMRYIKPLDLDILADMAARHSYLVTVEENVLMGGAGSAVNEALLTLGISLPILNLGLPDHFIDQGSRAELLGDCGLNGPGILKNIKEFIASKACDFHPAQLNSY